MSGQLAEAEMYVMLIQSSYFKRHFAFFTAFPFLSCLSSLVFFSCLFWAISVSFLQVIEKTNFQQYIFFKARQTYTQLICIHCFILEKHQAKLNHKRHLGAFFWCQFITICKIIKVSPIFVFFFNKVKFTIQLLQIPTPIQLCSKEFHHLGSRRLSTSHGTYCFNSFHLSTWRS